MSDPLPNRWKSKLPPERFFPAITEADLLQGYGLARLAARSRTSRAQTRAGLSVVSAAASKASISAWVTRMQKVSRRASACMGLPSGFLSGCRLAMAGESTGDGISRHRKRVDSLGKSG